MMAAAPHGFCRRGRRVNLARSANTVPAVFSPAGALLAVSFNSPESLHDHSMIP